MPFFWKSEASAAGCHWAREKVRRTLSSRNDPSEQRLDTSRVSHLCLPVGCVIAGITTDWKQVSNVLIVLLCMQILELGGQVEGARVYTYRLQIMKFPYSVWKYEFLLSTYHSLQEESDWCSDTVFTHKCCFKILEYVPFKCVDINHSLPFKWHLIH